MDKRTTLVWFRNDLRIHDNEILLRAVERSHQIIPVYCFDPRHFRTTNHKTKKTGVLRASFLLDNVRALKHALQQLGGDLIVLFGHPEEILPRIAERYHVDEVYHHREVAHEETHVSALVEEALWKMQINLRHFIGHTLYHKEDLPFPIKDIPDAFTVFKKKIERESTIRPQLGKPDIIRVPDDLETGQLPALSDLGFTPVEVEQSLNIAFAGGEAVALGQMARFLQTHSSTADYSSLSPYIAVGALSPNTLYHAVKEAEQGGLLDKKRGDQLMLKLLWRDYYRFMFKKHGNRFFYRGGLTGNVPETRTDEQSNYDKWKTADSGCPIVDKYMRQLNETGHISHHIRLIVAAYLIQDLGVDWLKGAAWFEEKLIDYSPATNYGNWAHLAGVGSSAKDNKPVDIKKLHAQFYPKEALAL